MSKYWKKRAKAYNKLKWVQDKIAITKLIKFSAIRPLHTILDAGCGTGVLAEALTYHTSRQIVAVDNSTDMLAKIKRNKQICYYNLDLEEPLPFYFDKIIYRMVMHHIYNVPSVFKNNYNRLFHKGELIIEEGGIIPGNRKKILKWYREMMALKEERHVFTVASLKTCFDRAGFVNIKYKIRNDRKFSINDWLDNSGQSIALQRKIYDIHRNAPDYVKKFYKMKIKNGEITINSPVLLIKGEKND